MKVIYDPFDLQLAVIDETAVIIKMFPRHKGDLLDADLLLELASYKRTTEWEVDKNAFYIAEVETL